MTKLETIVELKKLYRNYVQIVFNMAIKKPATTILPAKFRFSSEVFYLSINSINQISSLYKNKLIINDSDFYNNLKNGILKFTYNNHEVKFLLENLSGTYSIGDIVALFCDNSYKLNVTNKDVVDIGAETGDSSIYFAINGARRVIGLEPFPQNYRTAVKNIQLNNLSEKIIMMNAGISGETGNIFINDDKKGWVKDLAEEKGGDISIPTYTLEYVLNEYNLNHVTLKMDCEGCEYFAILNSPISMFQKIDEIEMEYHYGYEKLVDKLTSSGFEVEYTNPSKGYNKMASNPRLMIGMIYAKRKL